MKSISESTMLPISLIITILGGVFWITSMYAETKYNTASIVKMETKLEYLQSIDRRLAIIEDQIKRLKR